MWNPFARVDKKNGIDDEELPKFVRRVNDNDVESKPTDSPIAESRVEALLADGQRGLQENRIPEARQAYREVLKFLPDDPTAHHGMAMAADLTENWAEAEDHYRQALRIRPRDANLLCDIGYSYLLQNRYSEAASYLSQATQINPDHENAHANLALLDVRQGNRDAARARLTKRYGDPARVTQILASLDSTPASRSPASRAPISQTPATVLTASASEIPANASFEEIREILNRERIAGEQRRGAINIPADYNPAIHSVIATNSQNAAVQYGNPAPGLAQQPGLFGGPDVHSMTTATLPAVSYGTGNPAPGSYQAETGPQMPASVPARSSDQPMITPRLNPLATLPQYTANPGLPNPNGNQQPAIVDNSIRAGLTPPASSGGVVAVRPSGQFQPPTQNVSYGQPIGFGPPAANMPGQQNMAGQQMMPGQQNIPVPTNSMPGQHYPNGNQYNANAPNVQLEGLNVGPGSLFPLGQGGMPQEGQLRMANVASPGSNSVINGAMYGQPVSTLPSQEWMMQQQQQIQQLQSQSPSLSQNAPGYAEQNYTNQGYSSPQYGANVLQGIPHGTASVNGVPGANNGTTAPRPGNQLQPVNPLSSYENQLRQLDNQYNNTLQQLDRSSNAAVPRAQY